MGKDMNPKISIITPSYNQGLFIEDNIKSVKYQTYDNIEHIIIDGGSKDDTVNILKKHDNLKWVSEPDNGQSDAYNKGIRMSSGDFLLCLNSDDYLLDKTVISKFVDLLREIDWQNYSAFMGNCFVVDKYKTKITEMTNRNMDFTFDILLNKLPIVIHPATFFNANSLKTVGGFANDIHYEMDYDIFLKVSKVAPIKSIPLFISALRRHDLAKGYENNSWKFSWEFLKLRHKYGGSIFNKMCVQPLIKIFLKFILGDKLSFLLRNKILTHPFSERLNLSKFRGLTWYDK